MAKISLSKIIPVEIAPRQTYPPLCIDFRVIFKLIRKGIQRTFLFAGAMPKGAELTVGHRQREAPCPELK